MNNKIGKLFLFPVLILLIFNFTPLCVYGEAALPDDSNPFQSRPSTIDSYANYEYVIDSYDVIINVNENNTYDITENIVAYFNVNKHGIFRKIPLKNTITRTDGTSSVNQAKVSNLSVSSEYSTETSSHDYTIKLGSEDKTVIGEQAYTIRYTYNIGKDPLIDSDEFYYNIIGDEWDTAIGNITFTITMPKEFDHSKLGFSSGTTGSVNHKIEYEVKDTGITGRYIGILHEGEAVTARLTLDEGYFVQAKKTIDFNKPIDFNNPLKNLMEVNITLLFIVPSLLTLITIILWFKYGKGDRIVETVEFYPPDGLNSLEIGFLYKGEANDRDVISLLIYLANKGYIKITEAKEHLLFYQKKGFKITKLKEYDGNDSNERLFLKDLFKKNKTEVSSVDLTNKFYVTIDKILNKINSDRNENKILKSNYEISLMIYVGILISLLLTLSIPMLDYATWAELGTNLFGMLALIPFILVLFSKRISILPRILYGLFIAAMIICVYSNSLLKDAISYNKLYLFSTIWGFLCIFIMLLFDHIMPKRTPFGNEMLGKIRGFKNFLQTAEKSKLEALVMQDPSYFYDILPYTYVLGISNKWIKKFESITLKLPDWYDGTDTFNSTDFGYFMTSTMKTAQSSMTSSPSSSDGGDSGGGSSGGGSGGGGGGSW